MMAVAMAGTPETDASMASSSAAPPAALHSDIEGSRGDPPAEGQRGVEITPAIVGATASNEPQPDVFGAAADMGENADADRDAAPTTPPALAPGQGRTTWTREELVEQGLPPHQIDSLLARQYQDEHLMQSFRCWILWFSALICLLTPVMLGLLFWMLVAYSMNVDNKCDVPLRFWCDVVYGIVFFNATLNRPRPQGSMVVRWICRWQRDPHNPSPLPLRLRIYNALVTLFIFAWNCLGLHWVRISGNVTDSPYPSCKDVAPDFVNAVKVYATFNMTFTVFMYLNMVGVAHMLRVAVRRGLLRTNQAAPRGSMEKNTVQVEANDPALAAHPECCICLEEIDLNIRPAVKTKECEHIFCKQCLQGWLRVGRKCPLCRADLGRTSEHAE